MTALKHPIEFIRNIKIDGINSQCPILWTDIVKCESITESTIKNGKLVQKILPIQNETKCTCASLFLENELNNPLIKDWPIFAIGRDAFEALNGMLPEKTLMGIFHTSYGHLEKWVKEDKNNIESKMNELLVHSVKSHVWLPRNREEWGK